MFISNRNYAVGDSSDLVRSKEKADDGRPFPNSAVCFRRSVRHHDLVDDVNDPVTGDDIRGDHSCIIDHDAGGGVD